MAEGREVAAWNHTAALMALQANLYRDPKKRRRPFTSRDFHPHAGRRKKRLTVEQLTTEIMNIFAAKERQAARGAKG